MLTEKDFGAADLNSEGLKLFVSGGVREGHAPSTASVLATSPSLLGPSWLRLREVSEGASKQDSGPILGHGGEGLVGRLLA
mmetsp:Transcript_41182/g.83078  ORF Transcript_41182/g.83078 Transcript_41182/m.83078 type:complete len:81 (-) Transcript_41182:1045-1287(-)